jgi:hypothetical protein
MAREWVAVVAAEQQDEPFQVLGQLADAIGGVTNELFQWGAEAAGVAGGPPTPCNRSRASAKAPSLAG